jgi:hypothetical protein
MTLASLSEPSWTWSRDAGDEFEGSPPAPVSTFVRGGARKAKVTRRESLMASMQVIAAPQDGAEEDPPLILGLGVLLEQVMFAMDQYDAQRFRCSCKAVRAVSLTPGFAVLWRKTHEMEAKAKAEFARLKHFLDKVEKEEVETEVAPQRFEHNWERILPPRRKVGQSSSPGPLSRAARSPQAASSSAVEHSKPAGRSTLLPPRSVGEARTPAEIKRYFETLPELDTEPAAVLNGHEAE